MSDIEVNLPEANYVIAVSGGVDSVVLLDLLTKLPGLELIVAHFDHGIRPDSAEDLKFVKSQAKKYGLKFESAAGKLGAGTSEATARAARYKFLLAVCAKHKAKLITAHHQDDVVETAIINLIRGSGPRGLASLKSGEVIRPLLNVKKADILKYAKTHRLDWREDSTNQQDVYLRNQIRHRVVPKLKANRQQFETIIKNTEPLISEIDGVINELDGWLFEGKGLRRQHFVQLDSQTAGYVVHAWLTKHAIENISSRLVQRVVLAAKTLPSGKQMSLDAKHVLLSQKNSLRIDHLAHV